MNKPLPTSNLPTIAEARRLIEHDGILKPRVRREWHTALATLAELHDEKVPEVIKLDAKKCIALIESKSAQARLGVKDGTLANYRTSVRAVLRYFGLLASPLKSVPIIDGPWLDLVTRLPDTHEFPRLRSFVSWCAGQGVAPAHVSQQTLDTYATYREISRSGIKQTGHTRRVTSLWRKAANTVAGWPEAGLANPNPRQISLNFDAYPAPLPAEVKRYLTDIAAQNDIFADIHEALRDPVSDATVITRRDGARALLWGAVQSGIPIERLNSLRVLVDPDVVKPSLRWHMERKGLLNKPGQKQSYIDDQIATFVATIASVANYLKLPDDEHKAVKAMLKPLRLDPNKQGLIDRHERILDALDDKRTRGMLLHLPARMMREARRLLHGWTDRFGVHLPHPERAAWLASIAIAIEIELHLPIRMEDLNHLRLGHEVRLIQSGGSRWQGSLHIEQTAKTGMGIQANLQPETLQMLREYLDVFRPLLPNAHGVWLFPGEKSAVEPRNKSAFGTAITENVAQFIGIRVNPHAFRCIAGALILEADPSAIDDVRAILGHASFNTALRYYRRFSTRAAANRLGIVIAKHRRATTLPAASALPNKRAAAKPKVRNPLGGTALSPRKAPRKLKGPQQ